MNKILFIVEGLNDEVAYIERLFKVCNDLQNYEIVPYKTNIHTLSKSIINNGEIDDTLDIKQVLKEKEKDENIKNILSQNFSDIILVFDFEPQQDYPRFDLIRKLLIYFNNSTDNGKLYINYPMMQSYRHFPYLPYDEFKDLKVSKNESLNYKETVANISKYKNTLHHNYRLFVSLSYHHLLKLNYIINGRYEIPEINFIKNWNQVDLFDKQLRLLNNLGYIYVINTFSLYLIEYNPTLFYERIKTHKSDYSI